MQALLTAQEYAAIAPRFGLNREANFEGEWHLHTHESVEVIAERLNESAAAIHARIESARTKLLQGAQPARVAGAR